jgi:hypothetical protein
MAKRYGHFRGELLYFPRPDPFAMKPMKFFGNAPNLKMMSEETFEEHMESTSGDNRMDNYYKTAEKNSVELEVDQMEAATLAFLYGGDVIDISSGSFTTGSPDTLPTGLVAGDILKLRRGNVTSFAAKDSATPTPTDLTEGTHFKIRNAKNGTMEILSVTGLTQPIKCAYSYGAEKIITLMAEESPEIYIVGDLINLANQRKPCTVDIYRVKLQRPSEFTLLGDKVSFKTKGMLLEDLERAAELESGPYMKIRYQ